MVVVVVVVVLWVVEVGSIGLSRPRRRRRSVPATRCAARG